MGVRVAVAALALLLTSTAGAPALAAKRLTVAESKGLAAKRLTVSKTRGLDRAGETVTVTGRGYDVTKGIYVAFCLDNGAGVLPSPCGGGADMTGSSGSSVWISSNPPSYAEGLAQPYGPGGSFRVSINVTQMIGEIDCAVRGCAIVTRADHTRTSDRSQDKRVAIRFAPAAAGATTAPTVNPVTTAAPGKAKPTGKRSTPVGPPTGKLATAAPPQATIPVAALAAEPALSRTSSATPLGHWWAIGGAFLVGVMAASVIGRIRRRKQEQS